LGHVKSGLEKRTTANLEREWSDDPWSIVTDRQTPV